MDPYILILALLGLAFFGAAWLPRLVDRAPLSFPILYVAVGFLLFSLPLELRLPNPLQSGVFTERFTEMIVIVALTGAGLKLSRPMGLRRWAMAWRLLGLAMPLCIVGGALLGIWLLGLPPAAALLLGAVLAPTDPVLASDVQVGAPGEEKEGEVRFGLTAEAGLNDGLAFPFVNLAVVMVVTDLRPDTWLLDWFLVDVLYKLGVGTLAGIGIGYLFGLVIFRLTSLSSTDSKRDGFVVLAITLLTYGLTELLHGYGFLAVFLAALTLRQFERSHRYHDELHDFSEGFERLLMALVLILLGGLISQGLLAWLSWPAALAGLLIVLVLRPLTGLLSLLGSRVSRRERFALSFFGIRGIGSLYYLAYALNKKPFDGAEVLWSTVAFAILVSMVVHGSSATAAMRHLDRRTLAPGD